MVSRRGPRDERSNAGARQRSNAGARKGSNAGARQRSMERDTETAGGGGLEASSPSRRRVLAVGLGVVAVAGTTGCLALERIVGGERTEPPGSVVVRNDDEAGHDVHVVAERGDDGGSVVAEDELSVPAGATAVRESFLEEPYPARARASVDGNSPRQFEFDASGVLVLTVTANGTLNADVDST